MKRADASGAVLAVIIGDDEVASEAVVLKPLRVKQEQIKVALEQLAATVGEMIFEWDGDDDGGL